MKSTLLGLIFKPIPFLAPLYFQSHLPLPFLPCALCSSQIGQLRTPEHAMASSLPYLNPQGLDERVPALDLGIIKSSLFSMALYSYLTQEKRVYFKNMYYGMLHNIFPLPLDCEKPVVRDHLCILITTSSQHSTWSITRIK